MNLDTKDKTLIGIISTFFIGGLVPILPSLIQAGETSFVMIIISISSGIIAIGALVFLLSKKLKSRKKEIENAKLLNSQETIKCKEIIDYLKVNKMSIEEAQQYLKIIPFLNENMLTVEEIMTFIKIKETLSHRNVTMEEIVDYLQSIMSKPTLLKHKLFVSGEHKFLQKAISLADYNNNRGQCWVISMYHILKVEVVIERIKAFLTEHEVIINNDIVHLNVEPIKIVIWDSINGINENEKGYETIAQETYQIPEKFIREYNKEHKNIVNLLETAIELIHQASYVNDYNRYLSILNAVYLALEETFSEKRITRIFNINGELTDFYKQVEKDLDRGIKSWKRSYIP